MKKKERRKLNKYNEIVNFTLNKFDARPSYQIISLDKGQWLSYAKERISMDDHVPKFLEQVKEFESMDGKIDEKTKNMISEIKEMESKIQTEYGRNLSLDHYVNGVAASSLVLNNKGDRLIDHGDQKNTPFTYDLITKNKSLDFLILINERLFDMQSIKEKVVSIIHETLHYMLSITEQHFSYKDVEGLSKHILMDYEKSGNKLL